MKKWKQILALTLAVVVTLSVDHVGQPINKKKKLSIKKII